MEVRFGPILATGCGDLRTRSMPSDFTPSEKLAWLTWTFAVFCLRILPHYRYHRKNRKHGT